MDVIDKGIQGTCEWCKNSNPECDLVVWGELRVRLMCRPCIASLRDFLEDVDVKESEL